jgi:2-polyprenyl-3-methyl-5-hydroxy-6-metoxy-1,4-benzoquinol methylase
MERDYGAAYRELYERHWWWRAREAMLIAELRRLCPPDGFGEILDIGCGDGLFFDELRQFGKPQGIEPDAALVSEDTRRRGEVHVGTLEDFRTDCRFGLIVMADVLEHVQDDAAFLARALELLRNDGLIVATVPALPFLWSAHDEVNHHYRRYTRATLRALASRASAEVVAMSWWFRWTAPLRLVAKLARPRAQTIAAIPSAPINAALERLSLLDYQLRRLPLGPGTSLFALLRRTR